MGRVINVPLSPKRIVSLVPSQTELLYHLGLTVEVVGQTLFCIHPPEMHQTKPRVGGTKNFNIEKIKALNPDLIIGNKEENDKERIELLEKDFPVWMSDITTLDEALQMIERVGDLVNKSNEASQLAAEIRNSFTNLHSLQPNQSALYLIWRNPWMAAGKYTFIDEMLSRCGFINVCDETLSRYPEIKTEQIISLQPQHILLSSEPYPFKEIHMEELKQMLPQAQIRLVDGELFSWYGSRLRHSAHYFNSLINSLTT